VETALDTPLDTGEAQADAPDGPESRGNGLVTGFSLRAQTEHQSPTRVEELRREVTGGARYPAKKTFTLYLSDTAFPPIAVHGGVAYGLQALLPHRATDECADDAAPASSRSCIGCDDRSRRSYGGGGFRADIRDRVPVRRGPTAVLKSANPLATGGFRE
jgi:hypothetical protein